MNQTFRLHRAVGSNSEKGPYRGHWAEFLRESKVWVAALWDALSGLLALLSTIAIIYVMFRKWVF